jgi:hypothetical protein
MNNEKALHFVKETYKEKKQKKTEKKLNQQKLF